MNPKRFHNRAHLRRRPAYRDPIPRILVICEGKMTEPNYLKAFADDEKNGLVEVEAIGFGFDPRNLVEEAAKRKLAANEEAERESDENIRYDEVWCLFDIDGKPKERRVPEAKDVARARKIALGISNPSFELWGLLHFQEFGKPSSPKQVTSALKKHYPGYKKILPYLLMREGYENAVSRAVRLLNMRNLEGTPEGNPSTGVSRLTETIRKHGRNYRLKKAR